MVGGHTRGGTPIRQDPYGRVQITVSMLDGRTGVVGTSSDEKLGALRHDIAEALGLVAADSQAREFPAFDMCHMPMACGCELCELRELGGEGRFAGAATKMLHDASLAGEVASGIILVVVCPEPEDCVSRRFKHDLVIPCAATARATDEIRVTTTLTLQSGGRFTLHRHYRQSLRSSCFEESQQASGRWWFRADEQDPDGGVILLTGEVVVFTETCDGSAKRELTKRGPFRTSFLRHHLVGRMPTPGKWTSEVVESESDFQPCSG
eukprot:TRINITY_DN27070_c0_g1_i1.p1 TRINITY_DN27070_c0_g1~~TRINITY_DN27070_c0_g1_i1.p1  ORF type:complete len:265 (-),score=35.86 TRINITY_DN27070_c0_g1_i1:77-871(-)